MTKNFKEVIRDIKPGEIYTSSYTTITKDYTGDIQVIWKECTEREEYTFSHRTEYTLKRKEYTFAEAFAAYEEGKEIESCYSGSKFKGNEVLRNNEFTYRYFETFKIGEIRGNWYINE